MSVWYDMIYLHQLGICDFLQGILVGGFEHFVFFHILGRIIPSD